MQLGAGVQAILLPSVPSAISSDNLCDSIFVGEIDLADHACTPDTSDSMFVAAYQMVSIRSSHNVIFHDSVLIDAPPRPHKGTHHQVAQCVLWKFFEARLAYQARSK